MFAGVAAHSVCTGWASCDGLEAGRGVDIQFGVRSAPMWPLFGGDVLLHALGSVNTAGGISFVAGGASLRWNFADNRLYLAPGLGVAINDGIVNDYWRARVQNRRDLGSRVTWAPELTLGFRITPTFAVEVAFVHLSHLWMAGEDNPGLDMVGGRVAIRF